MEFLKETLILCTTRVRSLLDMVSIYPSTDQPSQLPVPVLNVFSLSYSLFDLLLLLRFLYNFMLFVFYVASLSPKPYLRLTTLPLPLSSLTNEQANPICYYTYSRHILPNSIPTLDNLDNLRFY